MGGRVRNLKGLDFRSAFNDSREGLQDLNVLPAVISFGVFFFIPETDVNCLVTLWGNEVDDILKSPLSAEQGNDLPLKNEGKLRRALGLELETDVVTIHVNLLGWTGYRAKRGRLIRNKITVP